MSAPPRKHSPTPAHPPPRATPAAAPARPWLTRLGLAAGALLMLAALAAAWLQPVRPEAGSDPPAPGRPAWWLYPLERNPELRLPRVHGDLAGVYALPGTARVWAVGRKGLILHTEDGGLTWLQQHPAPAAPAAPAQTAWLIAAAQAAPVANQAAANVYDAPVQQAAPDYSANKLPSRAEEEAMKKELLAAEAKKAVAAKRPAVRAVTKPAAQPAEAPPIAPPSAPAAEPIPLDADLVAVHFDDAERGWAAGTRGIALVTRDGGRNWTAPPADPAALFPAAERQRGEARQAIPPDIPGQAGLLALARADDRLAWAVGRDGLIVASRDGGRTWQRQTRPADASGSYARLPAPWTYAAFLLGLGLMLRAGRQIGQPEAPAPAERPGIAGLFVSDHPLGPGDPDPLGHGRVAEGLANFILNRNTEPGITLAITGAWGSGKSSIMRLLLYRLQEAGFRPAWFNAWHHQQEGRQLASLFNTIRRQAVPPLYTLPAWLVRGRLIWNRGGLYRLLILGVVALVLLGGFEAARQEAPLASLRQTLVSVLVDSRPVVVTPASLDKLRQGRVVDGRVLAALQDHMVWSKDTGACTAADGDCSFADMAQLEASLERLIAPRRLTDEERAALEGAAQHLGNGPQSMLAVLLGALVVPLLLGKGLAVYGLNYLDLIKRLLPEQGRVAGKEAVGTMENFRTEFALLTEALDGRLVLFIDDLDRCRCETVREVLELVNYLASVGQCFIVMGMAMEHVACCIEAKTDDQDRHEYALQYLKKLVNIEVPVPALDPERSREMLARQVGTTTPPPLPSPWRRWSGGGLALAAVLALSWGLPQAWEQLQPEAVPKAFVVAETAPATAAGPSPQAALLPEVDAGPVGLEAALRSGPNWLLAFPPGAALFGLAAWFGRRRWLPWLSDRGWLPALRRALGQAARGDDRPEFGAALLDWHQVILLGDPTPRGVKRFVNRVRFLAMMEQSQAAAERIPDAQLVGLAALHHARLPLDGGNNDHARAAMASAPEWPPAGEHLVRFECLVRQLHIR